MNIAIAVIRQLLFTDRSGGELLAVPASGLEQPRIRREVFPGFDPDPGVNIPRSIPAVSGQRKQFDLNCPLDMTGMLFDRLCAARIRIRFFAGPFAFSVQGRSQNDRFSLGIGADLAYVGGDFHTADPLCPVDQQILLFFAEGKTLCFFRVFDE